MTRHVRTESLAEADIPQVYLSLYQTFSHHRAIFVRGQLDPPAIEKAFSSRCNRSMGVFRFTARSGSRRPYRPRFPRGDSRWRWSSSSP